jgi:dTDP-4-dehydrorhamnose 3,5-epimerase
VNVHFVQDNESLSHARALRGLHFQAMPNGQAKLVRVARGAVMDVCVDIRSHSPTCGQHFKCLLDDRNKQMLFIPEGFAHGFVTLEDATIFNYKCSGYYHRPSERTVLWNDPALAIEWGTNDPIMSEKDRQGTPFTRNLWP